MLGEVVGGLVSSVEGVQRAVSPGIHDAFSAWGYDKVRVGVAAGAAAAGTVARLVGVSAPVTRLAESGPVHRVVGVVNGTFGAHAVARGGAVPAAMTVRLNHRRVALDRDSLTAAYPSASGRVVVFLHGLIETERSWFHRSGPDKARTGTDFGSRLADDLSCTPVYVRYNTGRHISENGRELVDLLAKLVQEWPVAITEIVLIGHSMGGLVVRSAVLQAGERVAPWLSKVTRVVCLGAPHTGAPLERGVVRVAGSLGRFAMMAPLVRLLSLRSDGIKDLARGSLLENADAAPGDAVLPSGVRQYFVAVTLSRSEGSFLGRLVGDLLVIPSSAGDPMQGADFEWFGGLHHFDLLSHDTVYDALLRWLLHEVHERAPGRIV
jgi:pimeloyl-ACP methyl ester carboxylesterase